MSGPETYKAGIIGLGNIGARYTRPGNPQPFCHAGGLERCEGIAVAAVADDLAANRNEFSSTWGEVPAFDCGEAMLKETTLDVAAVCTPAMTHKTLVLAAIEAGVPVIFVEKPLATSLQDIDELIRRADDAGSLIVVSHTRHWDPHLVRAARLVCREGRIGDIQGVTATCGGPVLTMAIHGLDLLCQFAGNDPLRVFGYTGEMARDPDSGLYEQPNVHGAVAEFKGGIAGYLRGQSGVGQDFTVEVIGSAGVLRTGYRRPVELWDKDGAVDPASLGLPERKSPFEAAYDEIVRYLRSGDAPQCTAQECLAAYELAFGIMESALSGTSVDLPVQNRDHRYYAFRARGLRPERESNN
jgi:predicted dehydrogenase